MTLRRALAALALIVAITHAPFLANSLEDIDSVNFALGVRDFDVAQHRPHPPGYPVYIALGKVATAVVGTISPAPASEVEARALSALSLLSALAAVLGLYGVFAAFSGRSRDGAANPWRERDLTALAATAITVSCPLFWYLAVRPMSDLPGLAVALAAQACLMRAWWWQRPLPDGDRRLSPAATAASGRMIVLGAFLAALSIGMRSQTVWFTAPLLVLVLFDRVGRGVAGALIGSSVTFVAGGLAWSIPLLVASGGLDAYLAALGSQAGEDFASGEMLYTTQSPRLAAFALLRSFVYPWDSTLLAVVVLVLAAAGVVQVLLRDRRSLAAMAAISGPYLVFHVLFQDTAFVRYALPLVPMVAFLAVRGATWFTAAAVVPVAALVSVAGVAVASPVLVAYGAEASPTVRVLRAMVAEARQSPPGVLAMHQTFVRPLEAEEVPFPDRLTAPPRREWLELNNYWKRGRVEPVWFLADPMRSDVALFDPRSREDFIDVTWPLVARPAFGGMRPAAVRWYRLPAPGWFAEEGWSLTPETAGMARLMGRGPHLGPIVAMVRRRSEAARILVGGRNLGAPGSAAVRFTLAIDGTVVHGWDTSPGFFLQVIEVPAGRLAGEGPFATLAIQSSANPPTPTAIEQFDLQNAGELMWGFAEGWQEAEYSPSLGVWRWTSDRATLQILGPPHALRITLTVESPLRYFAAPSQVRARAGDRVLGSTVIAASTDWSIDVPAEALAASAGTITIETDRTFVPAELSGAADQRRLGLRIFAVRVANSLTAAETTR